MSILVVDDSLVSRAFIADLLQEVGYSDLRVCSSIEDAYREIGFDQPGQEADDLQLILLDINLPGKSGIEACREFASHPIFRDIPIIIISGADYLAGLDAAFSAGAIDFITKPPSHTELLARVHSALRLKEEMDRRKEREAELLIVNRRLTEANEELERLSVTDSLTGLANRRFLNESLQREWLRAQRNSCFFSVLMVDIDHFKRYNDHYGHLQGDVCLQRAALALQGCLGRGADLLARYGGEEFIAILPQTDCEGAKAIAETFHEAVRTLAIEHADSPVAPYVTISIGVASLTPGKEDQALSLVKAADEALYRAKQGGRNRSSVSESS